MVLKRLVLLYTIMDCMCITIQAVDPRSTNLILRLCAVQGNRPVLEPIHAGLVRNGETPNSPIQPYGNVHEFGCKYLTVNDFPFVARYKHSQHSMHTC